jgi:hypothetical protein
MLLLQSRSQGNHILKAALVFVSFKIATTLLDTHFGSVETTLRLCAFLCAFIQCVIDLLKWGVQCLVEKNHRYLREVKKIN